MDFRIESTRGTAVESVHRVSVAVSDAKGRLVASAGDPDLVTFWRSAAKPFQAIPLVADGAADHWGFNERALALACASHSSEPVHRELAEWMLQQAGLSESQLACGPHPPLSAPVAEAVIRQGITMTPAWSNCSGKHAGMLALAKHHGWPVTGYETRGHPVQGRILAEVARWTGMPEESIQLAVDGCAAVCFGLPLRAMALAYARLGTSTESAAVRLRGAMLRHPELIGGSGRACTEIIAGYHGTVLVKIGADGIYCAALPEARLGLAIKIEDGDMRTAPVALLGVLRALNERMPSKVTLGPMPPAVAQHAEFTTQNTRGMVTGATRAAGDLRFSAP